MAHPDANIIFGAVIDDALGDEVRVTVIAAGFDKLGGNGRAAKNGRIARVIEGQQPRVAAEPAPSLIEEDEEVLKPAPATVVLDAEEDLDIPDFLKT